MSENYHAASCLLVALRDEFGPTISCVLASVLLRFVMTHLIRSTSEDCTLMLSLLGSGFPQLSSINTHFRGSDHISLHPLLVSISILFDEKENSSDPFFTCSCKWLSLDSSPVEALMPIESYLTDDAIIREIDLVLPSLQLVSGLVKFIVQCIAAFSESEVNDDLCSKYSELFLSLDLSAGLHGLTAREFSSNLFAMCKKLQGSSFTSSPSFAPSPASMLFCEIFSDFSRYLYCMIIASFSSFSDLRTAVSLRLSFFFFLCIFSCFHSTPCFHFSLFVDCSTLICFILRFRVSFCLSV